MKKLNWKNLLNFACPSCMGVLKDNGNFSYECSHSDQSHNPCQFKAISFETFDRIVKEMYLPKRLQVETSNQEALNCRLYGIDRYVTRCFGKHEYDETIDGKVDICFDDVHACELAEKNIIVKMK